MSTPGVRAGILTSSPTVPFEPDTPGIVDWFMRNPPRRTHS